MSEAIARGVLYEKAFKRYRVIDAADGHFQD
jgi:hypothetical protein